MTARKTKILLVVGLALVTLAVVFLASLSENESSVTAEEDPVSKLLMLAESEDAEERVQALAALQGILVKTGGDDRLETFLTSVALDADRDIRERWYGLGSMVLLLPLTSDTVDAFLLALPGEPTEYGKVMIAQILTASVPEFPDLIDKLLTALQEGDAEERLAFLKAFEGLREVNKETLAGVVAALNDPSDLVRFRATTIMSRPAYLSKATEADADALVNLIVDESEPAYIRSAALTALSQMTGLKGWSQYIRTIRDVVENDEAPPEVRAIAISSLPVAENHSPALIPYLSPWVQSAEPEIAKQASLAVSVVQRQNLDPAERHRLEMAESKREAERSRAEDPIYIRSLTDWADLADGLRSSDRGERLLTASAISWKFRDLAPNNDSALSEEDIATIREEVIPGLLDFLESRSSHIRVVALMVFRQIFQSVSPEDDQKLEAMIVEIAVDRRRGRDEYDSALSALGPLRPFEQETVDKLKQAMSGPVDSFTKLKIARLLGDSVQDHPGLGEYLRNEARHGDAASRPAAISEVARFSGANDEQFDLLLAALTDSDPEARIAALRHVTRPPYVRMLSSADVTTIIDLLLDPTETEKMRTRTARALGSVPRESRLPEHLDMLKRAVEDEDEAAVVRAAALEAIPFLTSYSRDLQPYLSEWTEVEDPIVAHAAFSAIRTINRAHTRVHRRAPADLVRNP